MQGVLNARFDDSTPPAPRHVGARLEVGEAVLLRKPGTWFDLKAELRALDEDLAVIFVVDRFERVPREWLRRAA